MDEPRKKPFFRRFTKKLFVVTNIFLSLLFIISCLGAQLDPGTWWFMGLINLSMPLLLALLVLFFIFWLLVKPIWSMLPLLTILVCWSAVSNVIPFNFSPAFQKQKENGRLRIMSWNVEHFDIARNKTNPEVKENMLALINEYKPDIACFQEVVGSDTPTAINNMSDIKRRLGFEATFIRIVSKWILTGIIILASQFFQNFP